jgi:hypothetical protein
MTVWSDYLKKWRADNKDFVKNHTVTEIASKAGEDYRKENGTTKKPKQKKKVKKGGEEKSLIILNLKDKMENIVDVERNKIGASEFDKQLDEAPKFVYPMNMQDYEKKYPYISRIIRYARALKDNDKWVSDAKKNPNSFLNISDNNEKQRQSLIAYNKEREKLTPEQQKQLSADIVRAFKTVMEELTARHVYSGAKPIIDLGTDIIKKVSNKLDKTGIIENTVKIAHMGSEMIASWMGLDQGTDKEAIDKLLNKKLTPVYAKYGLKYPKSGGSDRK